MKKKKNVKLRTSIDVVKMLEEFKIILQESFKLFSIAITMSISNASCERTFSCMRRLKNYLRTCMTNERLCNLAILYVEKHLSKDIDL